MLNAKTGALVKNYYIGGPLNVLPTVGATTNGTETVIVPVTAGLVTWATSVPGDLVALTLKGLPSTTATSSASGSTTTTTSVSTITTSAATVTKTVGSNGVTSTVTATISGGTTTVSSGGANSALLYGVAAVAVIFIIATGYLAMRGRRPTT
jgi:hypothetical protein